MAAVFFAAAFCANEVCAAPFTPGNLVVVQSGDGLAALNNGADQNAGFSEIFQLDLGSFKHWKSIKVHVGEFAQDYCGENIDIVYTLDSNTVTALFFDNSNRDLILSKAHCPHFPDYLNDGTETPPAGIDISEAFSHFCSERSSCIQEYFKKQANRKKLQSSFINVARELKIE